MLPKNEKNNYRHFLLMMVIFAGGATLSGFMLYWIAELILYFMGLSLY